MRWLFTTLILIELAFWLQLSADLYEPKPRQLTLEYVKGKTYADGAPTEECYPYDPDKSRFLGGRRRRPNRVDAADIRARRLSLGVWQAIRDDHYRAYARGVPPCPMNQSQTP